MTAPDAQTTALHRQFIEAIAQRDEAVRDLRAIGVEYDRLRRRVQELEGELERLSDDRAALLSYVGRHP